MRTSKPISTISYNSKEFLVATLNKWKKEHLISYWCIIRHIGEILEDGTKEKDHWHVYLEPNKMVDTMALQEDTIECDLTNSKPLKCISFHPSKSDDWTWYTLHNPWYLQSKCESRQYMYTYDDYIASDEDDLQEHYQRAMHSENIVKDMVYLDMLNKGATMGDLVYNGLIPLKDSVKADAFGRLYHQGEKRALQEKQRLNELQGKECSHDSPSLSNGQ